MKSPMQNDKIKEIAISRILTLEMFSRKLVLKISLNVMVIILSFYELCLAVYSAGCVFGKGGCSSAFKLNQIADYVGEEIIPFHL